MKAPDSQPTTTPDDPNSLPKKRTHSVRQRIIVGCIVLGVVAAVGGTAYWLQQQKYVYTDKAQISAPLISLGPQGGGILRNVSVHEGDRLTAGRVIASVGDESIQTRVDGIALTVNQNIGSAYNPGQPVVVMFEPKELRLVARIQEDKGLRDVFVGQKAIFTLDAFGSQEFTGTVETIKQTSRSGDVVFNISDQREEKEYEVKIAYDVSQYPEFLNGMSARVWLIK